MTLGRCPLSIFRSCGTPPRVYHPLSYVTVLSASVTVLFVFLPVLSASVTVLSANMSPLCGAPWDSRLSAIASGETPHRFLCLTGTTTRFFTSLVRESGSCVFPFRQENLHSCLTAVVRYCSKRFVDCRTCFSGCRIRFSVCLLGAAPPRSRAHWRVHGVQPLIPLAYFLRILKVSLERLLRSRNPSQTLGLSNCSERFSDCLLRFSDCSLC